MKKSLIGIASALVLSIPLQSMAELVTVDALANSTNSGTGTGAQVLTPFTIGESFAVTVDPSQIWSAGVLPRWSNADGLTGNLYATGADISGQPSGTLIGQDFGLLNLGGLKAPFGSLVGEWGNSGTYFLIGTNYTGTAKGTSLELYYFDTYTPDNTGRIVANVTAVPEPKTYGMMLIGLGMIGFMARRRKKNQV